MAMNRRGFAANGKGARLCSQNRARYPLNMKIENNTQESKTNRPIEAALSQVVVEPIIACIEDHAQVTMDAFGLCYEKLDAIAKSIDSIAAEIKRRGEPDG
jgi:hypothetical protein